VFADKETGLARCRERIHVIGNNLAELLLIFVNRFVLDVPTIEMLLWGLTAVARYPYRQRATCPAKASKNE